jgi:putative flippase GtrA
MKCAAAQVHMPVTETRPAAPAKNTGWQRLRRLLFRNVVAALAATGTDFGTYTFGVAILGLSPPISTVLGRLTGTAVNFSINRVWTFESRDRTGPQLWRYAWVSAGGAAVSALMVKLLLLTGWDYRLIWLITSLAVSWGWNLPLQRFFVFASRPKG